MSHEETEGVNAGNVLLFNENALSKCKFVLTIRKKRRTKTRRDRRTMGKWLTK